ncbi:MAG TPA: thioredoxin [Acholeplasmataceae bacterium]|nr:thioredoxin [Acholeplasmataceae bacterium]
MVKKISKNEFKEATQGLTLVDFYADWCGPCRMVSPIIEDLSNTMDGVNFVKVNVDEEGELAGLYGVRSIPTLILFKDGVEVNRIIGFAPKQKLQQFINSHM